MSLETREGSFLKRWSQRKQQARRSDPDSSRDEPRTSAPMPEGEVARHELTDADMPPLESLDERSDYSGYFSPKVSEELRRMALRKLFHCATFNVTDGLDDYAEDFTSFAKLGDVITHDMRRMIEREAERVSPKAQDNGTPFQPSAARESLSADQDEPRENDPARTLGGSNQSASPDKEDFKA